MTLIVGIKCSDGVVVAADGAATAGIPLGSVTVRQETKKLRVIADRIVIGTSGLVGIGQRFCHALSECFDSQALKNRDPISAMTIISERFRKVLTPEFSMAQGASPVFGNAVVSGCLSSTLVAAPIRHEACLFEFDHMAAPEEKTASLPFVSIGSGQQTADPFLAFLRKVLWQQEEPPQLGLGILSAMWSIRHAIETSPGGVADPLQVVILRKGSEDKHLRASELTEQELGEHAETIETLENKMARDLRELIHDVSPPPSPPSELASG